MCLDNPNPLIRNATALTFRDNKFDRAVPYLIKAIKKPENKTNRSTLFHALETMDCGCIFNELFAFLFSTHGNWAAHHSILTILDEQEFLFTDDDLRNLKKIWNILMPDWNNLNKLDESKIKDMDITSIIIDEFVNRFTDYLDEK